MLGLVNEAAKYVNLMDKRQKDIIEKIELETSRTDASVTQANLARDTISTTFNSSKAETANLDQRMEVNKSALEKIVEELKTYALEQRAEMDGINAAGESKINLLTGSYRHGQIMSKKRLRPR